MKTTHKEKLYLNEHDKKQLGAMIRWLRLQAGWTKQQLVDQVGILSLRTLISLEQGKIVKDDDIYDTLLDQFALSFNYTHPMDKHIEQMLSAMLSAYAHYDDEAMRAICIALLQSLLPYQQHVQEFFYIRILQVFTRLWTSQEYLSSKDYQLFLSCHDFLSESLQIMMEDALYQWQCTFPHNNIVLEQLYQQFHMHYHHHITRFSIGIVLHLSDKHHDYLQAFLILKECEQYELMHKDNPHALFSIYHWMSNLAIFIEPQQFEYYKEKALSYMTQTSLSSHTLAIFYYNIGGCYYYQKQYAKALTCYQSSFDTKSHSPLPLLIWMCHAQFCHDKTLPACIMQKIDVQACSKALRDCWHYFILKRDGQNAQTLETYIMKTLLPVLQTLAPEFHKVYHDELKALLPLTRNYKQLLLFEEKLNLA